jgi:hypothetical protein
LWLSGKEANKMMSEPAKAALLFVALLGAIAAIIALWT